MIIRKQGVFSEDEVAGDAANLTIDQLLRNQMSKGPHRPFLHDPPNKAEITGCAASQMTFRQVDRRVDALAGILRSIGLRQDDVVAIRLPNSVEYAIALLAIWRAGLVACLLPLSWRRREWTQALDAVSPKAILTTNRIGDEDATLTASLMAEKHFSVRFVATFGTDETDGVISLDSLIDDAIRTDDTPSILPSRPRAGDHVATITFTEQLNGIAPIPRCHASWIAASMRPAADLRLEPGARLLCPFLLSNMTGLCGALIPALLTGSTVLLHHPFDQFALEAQLEVHRPTSALLPTSISAEILEMESAKSLRSLIRVTPFGIGSHETATAPEGIKTYDYASFSEQALLPMQTCETGQHAIYDGHFRVRDDVERSPVIAILSEPEMSNDVQTSRTHERIRFNKPKAQPDELLRLEVRGAMAPDGPWVETVQVTKAGAWRRPQDSISEFPVLFQRTPDGLLRASRFQEGMGAAGGMAVSLQMLDKAYGRMEGADAAAVQSDEAGITLGIVPKGALPLDDSEVRASIDTLAIAEHKLAGRYSQLTDIPRQIDGEIDREQIARQSRKAIG